MDWGFLDHTSTGHKNKYLRDELLYAGGKKVLFQQILTINFLLISDFSLTALNFKIFVL